MMANETILWRRIDLPGHEACMLVELEDGWRVDGTAVWWLEGTPCALHYQVECDQRWGSRSGRIEGWAGGEMVRLDILRTPGGAWLMNGIEQKEVTGCADLDLGFTPSTNLLQIRRLALGVGEAGDAPAAWLPFPAMNLQRLEQRYHRIAEHRYQYNAPGTGYEGILETTSAGFIARYPELWEVVGR